MSVEDLSDVIRDIEKKLSIKKEITKIKKTKETISLD